MSISPGQTEETRPVKSFPYKPIKDVIRDQWLLSSVDEISAEAEEESGEEEEEEVEHEDKTTGASDRRVEEDLYCDTSPLPHGQAVSEDKSIENDFSESTSGSGSLVIDLSEGSNDYETSREDCLDGGSSMSSRKLIPYLSNVRQVTGHGTGI